MWVLLAMAIGSAGLYAALRTAITLVIVLIISMAMLLFATWLAKWVLAKDEGTADMQDVSAAWGSAVTCLLSTTDGIMYGSCHSGCTAARFALLGYFEHLDQQKGLDLICFGPCSFVLCLPSFSCMLTFRRCCRHSASAAGAEMVMCADLASCQHSSNFRDCAGSPTRPQIAMP